MFRRGGIDRHAADRIDGGLCLSRVSAAATGMRSRGMRVTVIGIVLVCHLKLASGRPAALDLDTLDLDTLGGYMTRMRTEIKTSCLKRLKRIEGQIRGLAGMVEDDRYCIDVVTQIAAAKAALRRVEEEILRDHVAHCVEHAISSGDKADQRRKIAELMDVVSRADR
jgi:DNA-binding FrmR family transcriptional regulator